MISIECTWIAFIEVDMNAPTSRRVVCPSSDVQRVDTTSTVVGCVDIRVVQVLSNEVIAKYIELLHSAENDRCASVHRSRHLTRAIEVAVDIASSDNEVIVLVDCRIVIVPDQIRHTIGWCQPESFDRRACHAKWTVAECGGNIGRSRFVAEKIDRAHAIKDKFVSSRQTTGIQGSGLGKTAVDLYVEIR